MEQAHIKSDTAPDLILVPAHADDLYWDLLNVKVSIERDQDPLNPREDYDNVCTLLCYHGRYLLGDNKCAGDPQDAAAEISKQGVYFLPVYMYDHGGYTISTKPFSCPWDSGQIGYIFVSKELAISEWGDISEEEIYNRMRGEIETYDQYLRGDIYGYTIESDNPDLEDSCWGFFGDDPRENGMLDNVSHPYLQTLLIKAYEEL